MICLVLHPNHPKVMCDKSFITNNISEVRPTFRNDTSSMWCTLLGSSLHCSPLQIYNFLINTISFFYNNALYPMIYESILSRQPFPGIFVSSIEVEVINSAFQTTASLFISSFMPARFSYNCILHSALEITSSIFITHFLHFNFVANL